MELKFSAFCIVWNGLEYTVAFQGDKVQVMTSPTEVIRFDNADAKWKPCKTHAMEILKLAHGEKVSGNHAKRRAAFAKPKFRVVG